MNKRLVVFAHFDIDDVIDDYVVYYLEQLHELCSDIVFVSTSQLPQNEIDKVHDYCISIICRENAGYDFMSYKEGLFSSGVQYQAYDELVVCNDSVYGPLFCLSEMFEALDKRPCDFWGVTRNKEINPHIQSYFIVFKKSVLISGAIEGFFSTICSLGRKDEVITRYEIGLTSYLLKRGFIYDTYIGSASITNRIRCFAKTIHYSDNNASRPITLRKSTSIEKYRRKARNIKNYFISIILRNSVNYTFYYWDYGLTMRNPFLKIALLRKSYGLIHTDIIDRVESVSEYPIPVIVNHLQRTKHQSVFG